MTGIFRLMRLELFVLSKDPRVRIKMMLTFLLIIYVLSYSLFETGANILPFYFFGFFFASSIIDYSFYSERIHKRFSLLLGKGFSLRQIIFAKSFLIFFIGLVSAVFFTVLAHYLNKAGILYASFEKVHYKYLLTITLYNFWIIHFSGLIQTRYEIMFPVRLLHIAGFLIFVNFQEDAANVFLDTRYALQITALILLSSLTVYASGKLNKDKIL
ncbi:MAG: hypothetical protein JXN63_01990 [Candidatus Delongbacteria bacterium]|nr:hypothetical protein [Candidatus Delongbacteria bacterium]